MSVCILSPKHFNSIEINLTNLLKYGSFSFPYSLKDDFPTCYNHKSFTFEAIQEEIAGVIDTLKEINVISYVLKYAHDDYDSVNSDIAENIEAFKKNTKWVQLSPHGLYNALRCLNYNIELEHLTGFAPLLGEQEQAMRFLKEVTHSLAAYIIKGLPEDKSNAWYIE